MNDCSGYTNIIMHINSLLLKRNHQPKKRETFRRKENAHRNKHHVIQTSNETLVNLNALFPPQIFTSRPIFFFFFFVSFSRCCFFALPLFFVKSVFRV